MQIVQAINTPVSAELAKVALVAALPGLDRDSYTLLLALSAIETANWAGMKNWNAGNITAGEHWPGGAWRPPWFTLDASSPPLMQELHERMLKGTAPSAFRAYGSLVEGFQDFAHELRSSFASVIEAAKTGDAQAFVAALHDSGYSRDYSQAHVPHFTHLQQTLGPLFAGFPAAHPSGASQLAFAGAGAALLFGIWAWKKGQEENRRADRRARKQGWLK